MVVILLGDDATLGNGCKIQEHLHSFKKVKFLHGYSKTFFNEYI